jgi:hypothetical protein
MTSDGFVDASLPLCIIFYHHCTVVRTVYAYAYFREGLVQALGLESARGPFRELCERTPSVSSHFNVGRPRPLRRLPDDVEPLGLTARALTSLDRLCPTPAGWLLLYGGS